MKSLISFLCVFSLFILLNGCSDVVNSPTEEQLIAENITGRWVNENVEILTLKNNGIFIDTTLTQFVDSPGVFIPNYVINGKYSIKNNILYFYDVVLQYAKAASSEYIISFGVTINPRRISISGNELNLQFLQILNPLENNYPYLSGKWESITWMAVFDRFMQPQFIGGEKREAFDFIHDSLKVNYSSEYLFTTSILGYSCAYDYSFEDNYLQFPNVKYKVEFKDNKMYWIMYEQHYVKIK